MRRRARLIVLFAVASGLAVVLVQLPKKARYDELVNQLRKDQLHKVEMGLQHLTELQVLRESWPVVLSSSPDEVFASACTLIGQEPTVDGVVRALTDEFPPYSFFNPVRNRQVIARVLIQAVITPISTDGQIHVGEGIAFVRLTHHMVEVFEDGEEGLSRYVHRDPDAPSANMQPTCGSFAVVLVGAIDLPGQDG